MNRKDLLALIIGLSMMALLKTDALASNQNELLNKVLSKYVTAKGVNYTDLCKDGDLNQYTEQLKNTDPKTISETKDLFAFWLNVYNAYSLQAICSKYPIKSINDLNFGGLILSVVLKKTVWDRPTVIVNHKSYTLRQVDHGILRSTFKDPRILFAIACGAVGCPPSRSEAYDAAKLDGQLDDQARRFFNDPKLNKFDLSTKTAYLSPLLNWSGRDFGKEQNDVLIYISSYLPLDLARSIRQSPSSWEIKYNQYDLTLNDIKNKL